MRKFTLIVAAIAFSICANAQGFYAVEKGTPTDGMEVTNVENIKLTWGTGWKANKEGQSGVKIGDNDCTVITQGDVNPTGVADGNVVPASGVFGNLNRYSTVPLKLLSL